MAIFIYDNLDEDQLIPFVPGNDTLQFLHPLAQAGHLQIRFQSDDTRVKLDFGPAAGHSVFLDGIMPEQLDRTNFVFVGGGLVLIGDDDRSDVDGDTDAGNNTLIGSVFGDFFLGLAGNDSLVGGAGDDMFSYTPGGLVANQTSYGNDTADGGDGFDWLYFDGFTGVSVNLLLGTATSAAGSVSFTSIEAVSGSGQGDTLIGNDAANFLDPKGGNDIANAGGGDDTILGFEGDDAYDGGIGSDWVHYDEADGVLFVDLNNGNAGISDHSSHTLVSIENILGSAFDDEIFGDENANVLNGYWGEDLLAGEGGNDILIGGGGNDFADYGTALTGVIVNLSAFSSLGVAAGTATDGLGGIDRLVDMDGANASAHNDTLIGGAYVDSFVGRGGADSLVGGAGDQDEIVYEDSPAAVNVNLSTSTAIDGYGTTDSISGFEVIFASDGGDTLTGDSGANRIHGRDGNDTIQGLGGADTLLGGTGVDSLTGGADSDMFWFFRQFDEGLGIGHEDVITDFVTGVDKIRINPTELALTPVDRTLSAAEFDAEANSIAEEADDRIIYNTSTGEVFYDEDGLNGIAAIKIFTLTSGTLAITDFDITNVIRWSELVDGDEFGVSRNSFDPDADIIFVDDERLSAADFFVDAGTFTEVGLFDGIKGVTLDINPKMLHGGNLVFADGSVLRLGDESIATGDDGNDTRAGGNGDDLLIGAGGNDSLVGGAGNDALVLLQHEGTGIFGDDTLDGGAGGADFVDFSGIGNGGFFVMGNETQDGSITQLDASSDITLRGIEGVQGTDGDDEFEANDQTLVTGRRTDIIQFFEGFDGDDLFYGAVGDGRVTYVSYRNSEAGVSVNLGEGFGLDTAGGADSFDPDFTGVVHIDGVVGSHFLDVLSGGTNSQDVSGRQLEFFEGLGGLDFIDGDFGADRVDYVHSPFKVVVNLGTNAISVGDFYGTGPTTVSGSTARDGWDFTGGSIDLLNGIEEARGSGFGDLLRGGVESNRFEGMGGNDTLNGNAGFAGRGLDYAVYSQSTEAVFVNLQNDTGRGLSDTATGGSVGIDTLISIEGVIGSDGNDSLAGQNGNGQENFDILEGAAGNDTVDGGTISGERDFNVASYGGSPNGVIVNIGTNPFDAGGGVTVAGGTARDGYGDTDTLANINGLQGSSFDDTLVGGAGPSDWVFYGNAPIGVFVDLSLALNQADDGWGGQDDLVDIENVVGSAFIDVIFGSDEDNILDGGEGIDDLFGGGGDDIFVFAAPVNVSNIKQIGNLDTATDPTTPDADKIYLDARFFPGLTNGLLAPGAFQAGSSSTALLPATRIVYDNTNGFLYFDADGTGVISGVFFAEFFGVGTPIISASDIVVFNAGALGAINWSTLGNGAVVPFNPATDVLVFDDPNISAADIDIESEDLLSTDFTYGGKTITLEVSPFALTTTNVTFQNGSRLLIGDNTTGTGNDDNPNTLTGSNQDDLLIGAGGADNLVGNGGNDRFLMVPGANGRYGNDTMNGGSGGRDRVVFDDDQNSGVVVTMGNETINGSAIGNDTPASTFTLIGIEAVTGTENADRFTANSSTRINGLRGDISQRFEGDGGNDTVNGAIGDGRNTFIEYVNDPGSVIVVLGGNQFVGGPGPVTVAGGTARDGYGGIDVFNNVDGVVGSMFADTLVGGGNSAGISGGLREFFEGLDGDDLINGRGNGDRVDYTSSPFHVVVNLSASAIQGDFYGTGNMTVAGGSARDGWDAAGLGTDVLQNIEQVRGSEFDDTIIGQAGQNNQIEGQGGGDSLVGGGDEEDTVVYDRATEAVRVSLEEGTGRSLADSITGGSIGMDTISGFGGIRGSDFGDHLIGINGTGDERYEFLEGHAGNDTLDGGFIFGALDFNLASYERSPGGAIINLGNAPVLGVAANSARDGYNVNGNPAGTDTLININVGWGSRFGDTMVGGAGSEIFVGRAGNDSLVGGDGPGMDVLQVDSAGTLNVIVNMMGVSVTVGSETVAAGQARDEFGGRDMVSGFEVVVGTSLGDFIAGNNAANVLEGLEGSDTLVGGGSTDSANDTLLGGDGDDFLRLTRGHDVLDGGGGFDWVQFVSTLTNTSHTGVVYTPGGTAGAYVNLGEYVANPDRNTLNPANNAELVGIDGAVGTPGPDLLVGGGFGSTTIGNFTEVFRPGAGNDTVHGANSRLGAQGVVDRVEYSEMTAAVIVNFGVTPFVSGTVTVQGGSARDAAGGTDTLIHVDWAVGTGFNDTLVGGNPAHGDFERFDGRGGNDLIIGGPGDGDEASYQNSPAAVNVNLELGTAADGHGGTDVLVGIEGVRGSNFSDFLTGSNSSATEVFNGEGGNDTIDGGTGAGLDFASWQTVALDSGGIFAILENGSGIVSKLGTDTLINIEGIIGTNYHGGDTLTGGLGDQTFNGRAGFDLLDGGAGSDTARYSEDPSAVVVNLSNTDAIVELSEGAVTVAGGTARDGWGDTWLVPHGNVLTLGISGEGAIDFRRAVDPASEIVGSWFAFDAADQATVVITFLSDGTYMLAEHDAPPADPTGQDGMERGTYTWNSATGAFTSITTVDTNGQWGFSHDPADSAVISGGADDTLTIRFLTDDELVLTRVTDSSNPLIGGWYKSGEDGENPAVLTILDAGSFLFAEEETFGDPADSDMERRTFVRDPVTGKFTVDALDVGDVDTNPDIGPSSLGHGIDTLTNIENAFGSRHDDILVGGTGANHLSGFDGDDEFWIRGDGIGGASGNDTLDGGAGNDHVSYQNAQGVPLNVRFDLGQITGGENDGSTLTVTSVESASGTSLGDTFTANSSTPVNGLSTDPIQSFQGMGGNDTILGAFGGSQNLPRVTLIEFTDSPTGVIVNLGQSSIVVGSDTVAGNRARDGFGTTDEFIEIDGVRGSEHGDFLAGGGFGAISFSTFGEYFEGMDSDDTIVGSESGRRSLAAYDHSPEGIVVDLDAGTAQDGWGDTDTLVNIRMVRGSAFNDILLGSDQDREEWFEGGGGNDTILGGAQGDNVLYTQASGGVFVSLAQGTGRALDTIGGAGVGVDTFTDIEFVYGSDFADSLVGGGLGGQPGPGQTAADFEPWEVALFFGVEEFHGGAGNDTISGGDTSPGSLDIAEYKDAPGAAIVNLSAATVLGVGANRANDGYGVNGNPAGIDVLVNINGVGGSNFNDTLVGGAGNEFLAGRGGNDSIVGGAGVDFASYESGGSVGVNLGTGLAVEGPFADTLSGIENVLGSSFNDTLIGDNGANLLIGEGGDDSLMGGDATAAGGANDTLFGGEGDDVLIQSRGADRLIGGDHVSGDLLAYNVGALAAVNVNLAAGTSNAGGHIATVSGIELVRGTLGNDTFAGGDPLHAPGVEGGIFEIFRPSAGNDTITGMGGAGWRTIVDYGGGSDANTAGQSIVAVLGNSNNVGFINDGRGGLDVLVNVDEVRGGAGNDLLVGGSYASSISGTFFESFRGNAGNDTLDGGGSDTVLGSLGALDRAEYGNNTAGQVVRANVGTVGRDLGGVTVAGGQAHDGRGGIDTLIDIDVLQGGAGDDSLAGGNPFNDSFERFEGRGGDDFLDGGSGNDEADYSSSPEGVVVHLDAAFALDGFGGTDELVSIEWARGSDFNDTLIGGAGNSVRLGGGLGDDFIDGGTDSGVRYASFSFAGSGANAFVENGSGTAFDGQGGTDTLVNINGLWGSGFGDTLVGGEGNQRFRGNGRSDIIDGGPGEDRVVYLGDPNPSGVIVNLGTTPVVVGLETVAGGTARDGWGGLWGIQGIDTLISIEGVEGSTFGDYIVGSPGGGSLRGHAGNDTLIGGSGRDEVVYDSATTGVIVNLRSTPVIIGLETVAGGSARDGEGGTDTLSGIEEVTGSIHNDTMVGGNDEETTEVFAGGGGNDSIDGGGGIDFASWFSASGSVIVTLAGGSNQGAIVAPGLGNDTLTNIEGLIGSDFGDSLTGGAGDQYFRGGEGADTLTGGADNDTADYSDDAAGVSVNLASGTAVDGSGDTDTLSQIENAEGSAFDDALTGNSQANTLFGGEGDDSLVGGDGDDFILGGEGIDTASYATSPGDVSVDLVSGTVQDGFGQLDEFIAEVENVIGSDFNDTLIGDGGNNLLEGGNGDDFLVGNAGNDTLDGGANDFGGDTMVGGLGDDTYFVDDGADIGDPENPNIVELAGQGIDTIITTVSISPLPDNIEIVRYIGVGSAGIFGNAGNNTIISLVQGNTMGGGGGNDTISYSVEGNSVTVDLESGSAVGAGGEDFLFGFSNAEGGSAADELSGTDGANVLNGNAGADTMSGGDGNDTYFVDDVDDVVIEENPVPFGALLAGLPPVGFLGVGGIADTIVAAIDFSIESLEGVENLTLSLSSLSAISATGNLLANVLTGNDLGNSLIGGAGSDTLDGGAGADAADYSIAVAPVIVNLGATNVVSGGVTVAGGTARDGSDTVGGAVDTLISIENAKGSAFNDTLVGSGGDNQFLGEAGNDSVLGGAGNDLLNGGDGNDVLDGGLNSDALDYSTASAAVNVNIVTGRSLGGAGNDTLRGFENVIGSEFNDTLLGGAAAMLLQGGAGADRLTGGAGSDTLDGGAGNDTMAGGLGNDFYSVDAAPGDVITDTGGVDTVVSTVTYTLGSTLDRLALTGTANISGTGNALANQLVGNSGNNTLDGGAGNDTLIGGDGSDVLDGGVGNDSLMGGAGDDTYFVGAASDRVVESVDEGDDTVISTVTFLLDAPLNANIENVTLTGVAAANINGTAGVNILHGNAGVNTITGGAGSDVMTGGAGNDVFVIADALHHTQDEFLDGGLGLDTIRFLGATSLQLSAGVAGIESVLVINAAALDVDASLVTGGVAITGNAASNVLTGGDGDDTLFGGGGTDTLQGGLGNDFLLIAPADQGNLNALDPLRYIGGEGAGVDVGIYTGTTPSTIVLTNDFASVLRGVLLGTATGAVTGTAAIHIDASGITFDDGVTLIGNAAGNRLTGAGFSDDLSGNAGNDTLVGDGGSDDLTGGAGTDSMAGGTGDDVFHFTLAADYTAAERIDGGAGADLLVYEGAVAGVLTLNGANVVDIEQIAVGSAGATINAAGLGQELAMFGGIGNDYLTGTSGFADTINGSDGNDTLAGGGVGVDTLNGGAGNDVILVGSQDDLLDSINGGENTDGTEDFDTLRFTATAAGAALDLFEANLSNVEQVAIANAAGGLTANAADVDASAISAYGLSMIGNNGANVLIGTEAAPGDQIFGNGGNDSIVGGVGADMLNGGAGRDTLLGGADNDLFLFASLAEVPVGEIIDGGDEGNDFDTLRYTGGAASITLGPGAGQVNAQEIEIVQIADMFGATTGIAAINVNAGNYGSALSITGNNGINNITGTGANDTLIGNGGNDNLTGGNGNDSLSGGDGNDTLTGGLNADTLLGGEGNDLFVIGDNLEHLGAEAITGGGGKDTIRYTGVPAFFLPETLVLSEHVTEVEEVVITGSVGHGVDASAVGGSLTIIGNGSGNALTGGLGQDSLTGVAGNDTLVGNAGNDTLVGGVGADSMTGGEGDDFFLLASTAELTGDVINGGDGGSDALRYTGAAAVLINLTGNITGLEAVEIANALGQFTGTAAIGVNASAVTGPLSIFGNNGVSNLTGTSFDDLLAGNGGNDILVGGEGNDTLIGGAGNDILAWDALDGSIQGGDGTDTLRVDGAGREMDLRVLGNLVIENVEVINLTGSGNNTLTLNLADVLALSGTTDQVQVDGNAGDVANIGGGWTQIANQTLGGQVYERYTQGLATLLVDLDMTVTNL